MNKETAWGWFSKYIRMRDCILTTGRRDEGMCFTCGAMVPFGELQAGHGVGGRKNGILFDPDVVHAQCVRCNMYLKGNYEAYIPKLIKIYGVDWYEAKVAKSKKPIKIDYDAQGEQWKQNYKTLLGEYNEKH